MNYKLLASFTSKYVIDENGCWIWIAASTIKGYPIFDDEVKTRRAHRMSYEHFVGPIKDELDHLCRVTLCVNWQHLEDVTRQENMRRRFVLITHCPSGHEYTQENTYFYKRGPYTERQCKKCKAIKSLAYYHANKAQ